MSIFAENPMLFKKGKDGKIVSYRIFLKYSKTGFPTIVKQTGKLLGKKITHEEEIKVGKNIGRSNETSPKEQATNQFNSDWRKKKDEGYKDLQELGYSNPDVVVTAATSVEFLKELNEFLLEAIGDSNTDANGQIKPMLAETYTEKIELKFPIMLQPKLDGVRCLCILDKVNNTVVLLSRKGKKYKIPHITEEFRKWLPLMPVDFLVFDGELYNHEMEFNDISSAVKTVQLSTKNIAFCVYDLVETDLPFSKRKNLLVQYLGQLSEKAVKIVPTVEIHIKEKIMAFHDKCIENTYEGAMIRIPDSKYRPGVRSSELLKVKIFDESEFEFMSFDATGHRGVQDLKAVCKTPQGKKFNAPMNGTVAQKKDLYAQFTSGKIKAGDMVTVKYFGLTSKDDNGVPRFPKGKSIRNYE